MTVKAMTEACGKGRAGFTIVELLVAMAILIFVSIALLQTAIVNIEYNTKNALRDEGTRLGGERLDEMRNFSNVNNTIVAALDETTEVVTRKVRNIDKKYTVLNSVEPMLSGTKVFSYKISTKVTWRWKGVDYHRNVSTVRPRK